MQNMNERPLCHRAEDLVSYLYGEVSDEESRDFAGHLRVCDACRSEFTIFEQVHGSILEWRSEALGVTSFAQLSKANSSQADVQPVAIVDRGRKLSAVAAIGEFFRVSPLWLRGATAVAAVLFCVLVVLAIGRFWQRTAPLATNNEEQKTYTASQLKEAVSKAVEEAQVKQIQGSKIPTPKTTGVTANNSGSKRAIQRSSSSQLAFSRHTGLTRQERQQLAADLRLIPNSDDDELPFVLPSDTKFPNEPN